jgi:bacterioferritin-associated ferredoxin
MYVCICNAFTDKHVRQVAESGKGCVANVYKSLGCRPQCGKCVDEVRALLAVNTNSPVGDATEAGVA